MNKDTITSRLFELLGYLAYDIGCLDDDEIFEIKELEAEWQKIKEERD